MILNFEKSDINFIIYQIYSLKKYLKDFNIKRLKLKIFLLYFPFFIIPIIISISLYLFINFNNPNFLFLLFGYPMFTFCYLFIIRKKISGVLNRLNIYKINQIKLNELKTDYEKFSTFTRISEKIEKTNNNLYEPFILNIIYEFKN
jgi:hypothetical protein